MSSGERLALDAQLRAGADVVSDGEQRRDNYASFVGGRLEEIAMRARRAVKLFGPERVLLTPDCGFATFADNPVASPSVAEAKLRAIAEAAELVRRGG